MAMHYRVTQVEWPWAMMMGFAAGLPMLGVWLADEASNDGNLYELDHVIGMVDRKSIQSGVRPQWVGLFGATRHADNELQVTLRVRQRVQTYCEVSGTFSMMDSNARLAMFDHVCLRPPVGLKRPKCELFHSVLLDERWTIDDARKFSRVLDLLAYNGPRYVCTNSPIGEVATLGRQWRRAPASKNVGGKVSKC